MPYPPENNIPAPPGPKIPNEQISTRGMVEICSFGIFGPGKWEEREYYFLGGYDISSGNGHTYSLSIYSRVAVVMMLSNLKGPL
jgi:hypothetical protein